MFRRLLVCSSASLLLLLGACGPGDDNNPDGVDAGIPDLPDADGDGIADEHEGRDTDLDTDGDGTPDYLDTDSDDDGIPDYREAGDDLSGTPPVDSDADGIPDFQDTDSDNNGREDGVDGVEDLDSDGIGNFADLDDDGDGLTDTFEIGDDPANPLDSDGDNTPDFQDTDSDNDTILDAEERGEDPDMDDIPAYLDDDSDGDCIPDSIEAGDADLNTPAVDSDNDNRKDFLDLDSDGDGLSDGAEDANCNGVVDTQNGETDPTSEDTDGDGVSDLVEVTAGTDPNDNMDNPQANGDFVFIVPYQDPPSPMEDDLDFSTDLQIVDVYLLIDRSGSMTAEITDVRNNIAAALDNLTCPPLGNGDPNDCISDLWSGVGGIGYAGSGNDAYRNYLDLQPDPSLISGALNTSEPGGCCDEILQQSIVSTCTGGSAADAGCGNGSYGSRLDCTNSPAGVNGVGYPCFRNNALPVILFSTDEYLSQTANCPSAAVAINAANAIGAKIVGIQGNGGGATLTNDMNNLATQTGAVDANNGNAPLVFNGADANATDAIETAIRTLANGIPLDVSAISVDDPNDAVDAVAEFIDHLETLQLGTPECTMGLTDRDTNADSFADEYVALLPGTPVCWKLVAKMNTTVMPTVDPQLFTATIEVYGGGVTLLDTRDVFFLVPPEPIDVPID